MFRDLRTQILLWTILPLTVLLTLVVYLGINSHQTAMRSMVAERDGALVRVDAAEWSDVLSSRARLLSTLDPHLTNCDTACAAFDGGVAGFDQAGNLVGALPSANAWASRRARVNTLIAARRVGFSAPFDDAGTTRILVVVPTPAGYAAGVFAPPALSTVGLAQGSVAYLVDAQGHVILASDASKVGADVSQRQGIAQVLHGEFGTALRLDARGNELVIGYAPIAATGWGLLIEEPWANVVEPLFQYSVLLPLALLFVAVVALGAIYFGIRFLHRPMEKLAQAANRIAYGDYRAAEQPVGGIHEIEELRQTLNDMAHQLHSAQAAMKNYIVAITRGQEDERMRLAREMHDDTIQSLIALQQRVEMVQKALARDPAAAAVKIEELKELLSETLTSVRRFVRDLRPTYLEELGLIPALEMLTRESHASFEVIGEEQRLDAERELVLFRIVQESLRNIAKHARATRVSVKLAFEANEVTATVEDDGVGFNAPEAPAAYAHAGHFGLMGMQERAQLFGGNVYVKSERGKGTKVIAYVPMAN